MGFMWENNESDSGTRKIELIKPQDEVDWMRMLNPVLRKVGKLEG